MNFKRDNSTSKLIICKHCGNEIAASAKACPHCGGKNKKPIYKKAWFWVIVILILLGSIGGGNRSSKKSDPKVGEVEKTQVETNETNDSEIEPEQIEEIEEVPVADVQTIYKVGDILHDGNTDIVYVSSGDYEEENQFMQPQEGNKYIFLNFAFINTSDKSDTSISFYSFECYADGYSCDAYYGGEDDLSATLSAGRSTMGCVYFEVPTDAQEIEVEYETNFFTDKKITFAFEGDLDCGYELVKNTSITEGALKVGEKIESTSLNITYLDCFEDKFDNMFVKPKDGNTFITCEFEFENLSKSDMTVSAFSFDCYADGASCSATYFRDDNLSATISSGRKAKGTVTFEVPKDAEVVEVEYLTNFWTSNRVVFLVEH